MTPAPVTPICLAACSRHLTSSVGQSTRPGVCRGIVIVVVVVIVIVIVIVIVVSALDKLSTLR